MDGSSHTAPRSSVVALPTEATFCAIAALLESRHATLSTWLGADEAGRGAGGDAVCSAVREERLLWQRETARLKGEHLSCLFVLLLHSFTLQREKVHTYTFVCLFACCCIASQLHATAIM